MRPRSALSPRSPQYRARNWAVASTLWRHPRGGCAGRPATHRPRTARATGSATGPGYSANSTRPPGRVGAGSGTARRTSAERSPANAANPGARAAWPGRDGAPRGAGPSCRAACWTASARPGTEHDSQQQDHQPSGHKERTLEKRLRHLPRSARAGRIGRSRQGRRSLQANATTAEQLLPSATEQVPRAARKSIMKTLSPSGRRRSCPINTFWSPST